MKHVLLYMIAHKEFESSLKMKFQKQTSQIDIIEVPEENFNTHRKHGYLLPSSIRAIVVGFSNTGKTNAVISLLTSPNGLKFNTVYIYSKSLNQPKYQFLKKVFLGLKEIQYFTFSNNAQVLSPQEANKNSLMIFDDICLESQKIVQEYFSASRHNNIDIFYISQSYAQIPKQLIRDNCNFLIIFPQDMRNLKHIYDNHVNSDMSFENFQQLCAKCWMEKYGFLVIDKESLKNEGRYRKTFNYYVKFD